MTKEEAARKFVSTLTEQQCRDMLVPALIAMYPAVFLEIEKATTPNYENKQALNISQELFYHQSTLRNNMVDIKESMLNAIKTCNIQH